jgi:ribosomal protein S3AE
MNNLDDDFEQFLQKKWDECQSPDVFDDEDLVTVMSYRIKELMARDFETLMSMMYRLDIDELKIKAALSPHNPAEPSVSLAKIIIERQKKRMDTKRKYTQPSLDDFIDFV